MSVKIDHNEMKTKFDNVISDFKKRREIEWNAIYAQQLELAIRLVEERYKTFTWRGSVGWYSVGNSCGSYLFDGLQGGSCKTVHMDNSGFLFESNKNNDRIPLRELKAKSVRLMIDLVRYMNSK